MNKLKKFIRHLSVVLLIPSILTLSGCAAVVVGGAAAGGVTYSYITGKLTKTYESGYKQTVQAARSTLEKLKIPITDTIADGLKTEFKAKRPDETPVAIEIIRIDPNQTQVSVRTGTLGVWDRRVSEQIHDYIKEGLGQKMVGEQKPSKDAQPTIGEVVQPGISEENLAEETAPATASASPSTVQIFPDSPNVIFFGNESNALTGTAIEKLDRIYEMLTANPEATLMLNGYSDSYGEAAYNLMISESRADVVKSHLVGKGIDPTRITTQGHGAQRFIASNKTREGRRMNRRVEIEIIGLEKVE